MPPEQVSVDALEQQNVERATSTLEQVDFSKALLQKQETDLKFNESILNALKMNNQDIEELKKQVEELNLSVKNQHKKTPCFSASKQECFSDLSVPASYQQTIPAPSEVVEQLPATSMIDNAPLGSSSLHKCDVSDSSPHSTSAALPVGHLTTSRNFYNPFMGAPFLFSTFPSSVKKPPVLPSMIPDLTSTAAGSQTCMTSTALPFQPLSTPSNYRNQNQLHPTLPLSSSTLGDSVFECSSVANQPPLSPMGCISPMSTLSEKCMTSSDISSLHVAEQSPSSSVLSSPLKQHSLSAVHDVPVSSSLQKPLVSTFDKVGGKLSFPAITPQCNGLFSQGCSSANSVPPEFTELQTSMPVNRISDVIDLRKPSVVRCATPKKETRKKDWVVDGIVKQHLEQHLETDLKRGGLDHETSENVKHQRKVLKMAMDAITSLQKKHNDVNEKLKQKEDLCARLEKEMEGKNKSLDALQTEVEEQKILLEAKNKEKEDHCARLREIMEDKNGSSDVLQTEVQELKVLLEAKNKEVETFKELATKYQFQTESLKKAEKRYETVIKHLNMKLTENCVFMHQNPGPSNVSPTDVAKDLMGIQIQKHESTIRKQQANILSLTERIQSYKRKCEELKSDLESNKLYIQQQDKKIFDLGKELCSKTEIITRQQEQIVSGLNEKLNENQDAHFEEKMKEKLKSSKESWTKTETKKTPQDHDEAIFEELLKSPKRRLQYANKHDYQFNQGAFSHYAAPVFPDTFSSFITQVTNTVKAKENVGNRVDRTLDDDLCDSDSTYSESSDEDYYKNDDESFMKNVWH